MKKSLSLIIACSILATTLIGCSSKAGDNVDNNNQAEKPAISQDTDIWEKYDPAIDISVVASYNVPEDGIVPKDTTPENQKWVEIMEKNLGIKLKYDWVVPASQGEQKLDVTIASGKIPDVLQVDEGQFELLKQSEMLGDLTDAYQYLMEPIRKNLEADPALLKKCTNEAGQLVAIPSSLDNFQQTQLIYIREDWLEELGLEVPTSMDQLFDVAKAFKEKDPNRTGKDDTIGIGLYKELYAGFGGASGLMNGYGAYPNMWIEDSNGSLVSGDIQPEMRNALEMLQKMYKEGILDPEYVAMDSNKMTESVVAGKTGIVLGEWWVPAWPLNLSIDSDPDARWKAINLVSEEAGIANTGLNQAFIGSYNVISKDMKNPEALAKMLNIYYDTLSDNVSEREEKYDRELWKPENGYVYNWSPVTINDPFVNVRQYKEVNEALKNDDASILEVNKFVKLFDATKKLETDFNGEDWGLYYSRVAEDGGFGLTQKVREEKLYKMNAFYGEYTPTMVTSQGILDTLADEVYHRIITGAPIEEFDKFVEDWHKMGGEQITQEVNEWYKQEK